MLLQATANAGHGPIKCSRGNLGLRSTGTHKRRKSRRLPRRPRCGSWSSRRSLYTGKKGFEAPPESVNEASNPRIWVLVIEGHRKG